jgi:hypothetical protein
MTLKPVAGSVKRDSTVVTDMGGEYTNSTKLTEAANFDWGALAA